jgi:hypothetical protein
VDTHHAPNGMTVAAAEQSARARVASRRTAGRTDVWIAMAFIGAAMIVRLPLLVFPSVSWDEGLYWAVAQEINDGHLPYVTAWDRKPVGIFLLYALADRLFDDALLGIRWSARYLSA